MENLLEKRMENEMATELMQGLIGIARNLLWPSLSDHRSSRAACVGPKRRPGPQCVLVVALPSRAIVRQAAGFWSGSSPLSWARTLPATPLSW